MSALAARANPSHAPAVPQVLIPFDRREAGTLKEAAARSGRSVGTVRIWCATMHVGRRVAGGAWLVSMPALNMLLDGDRAALQAYLAGDRSSESVVKYFRRHGIDTPLSGEA